MSPARFPFALAQTSLLTRTLEKEFAIEISLTLLTISSSQIERNLHIFILSCTIDVIDVM